MLKNLLTVYTDTPRHWCPYSERYTGCDSLMTAIDLGWTPSNTVFVQYHHFNERKTPIYYFYLIKDGQMLKMRVVDSPFITRILTTYNLKVLLRRHQPQQQEPVAGEPVWH